MRLEHLLDRFRALQFPLKEERTHPDRAVVLAARSSVQAAVVDDEFLADCIALELRLIESNRPRRGLVPFCTMPDLGIRLALGYWAPGNSAGAHEHTAWTITAVCRNELEVLTYSREDSYRKRELVPKNRFHATAGRAGFIFEPCIHAPRNISGEWSLSFHVTSPRDGEPAGDYEQETLPSLNSRRRLSFAGRSHPYASVVAARLRNTCVHELARVAAAMKVRQAPDLLDHCFALGSATTRKFINQIASPSAPRPALLMGDMLVRTHKDLIISHHSESDMVALQVETPRGAVEEFAINDVAREAMAFVARENMFEVRAIPGKLSDEERIAIGEMLEETGLFSRSRGGIGNPMPSKLGEGQ